MINLKVLDLSHHNQVNSFEMIRDFGIIGVILKATQGTYMRDQTYPARYAAAKKAGLLVGAYHFPDSSDPAAQLEYFLDYANLQPDDLGALDFEEDTTRGHTMQLDQARYWLANFEQQFGRKAILYSGNLIKETLRGQDDFLSAHKLWLPQYSARPVLPPQWKSYWLWQYTDGTNNAAGGPQRVSGVTGLLDCNHYPGLDAELVSSWAS
jgi:GH25 family lysozyme M1 (1,4-beta-N-acetylmuramidase)